MMIGKTVYVFDINRRVYAKPEPGRLFPAGGPIWREHWVPQKVVSETKRSWVTDFGMKIPKNGRTYDVAWEQAEVEQAEYVNDNSHRIAAVVGRLRNYDQLKAVADLVGYKPGEQR